MEQIEFIKSIALFILLLILGILYFIGLPIYIDNNLNKIFKKYKITDMSFLKICALWWVINCLIILLL